jgi:uncharacterized protein YutE (UPF0331/DUF86 family)
MRYAPAPVNALIYRSFSNVAYHLKRVADRHFGERLPIEHSSIMHFHSMMVLLTAFKARNRARKESAERSARGDTSMMTMEAIVALIVAAAAAEAFINEFAENVGTYRKHSANWSRNSITPEMEAAAAAVFDCDFARDSVSEKFVAASRALSTRFDEDGNQFQDLDRLIRLRNAIMHATSPRTAETHAGVRFTEELAQRGIALSAEKFPGSWFDRLQVPAVGEWACTSARESILGFLNLVPITPNDPLRSARELYRNHQGFHRTDLD